MSKFQGIKFPFFGLDKVPNTVYFTKNEIFVTIGSSSYLLDDKTLPYEDFLTRVACLELNSTYSRLKFKYTALSLDNLITVPVKWGVDSTGKIFDLSKKEKFLVKCVKVDKIEEDLIWVKGISYPFKLKEGLTKTLNSYMFVILVQIDKDWCIKEFSYSRIKQKKEIAI